MPLAHILAPQIAQKVNQIEADLGRAPQARGYLQTVGSGAAKSEGMPLPQMRPGETAADAAKRELRAMPAKRPDQVFRDAAIASAMNQERIQKHTQLLPLAPAPPQPASAPVPKKKGKPGFLTIGPGDVVDELGRPVAMPPAQPGKIFIDPNTPLTNEYGEPVDKRGKKLAYTGGPGPGMRYLDRRAGDVGLEPRDNFDAAQLEKMFGPHLKEMEANRDAEGLPTDKFPEGYFKGKSKTERENIIKGVRALRGMQRGTRT